MKRAEDIEKTFQEAYEVYADAIFRFCFFKVSDREKAFDLTQETFVRFWDYIRVGKEVQNHQAFLYRIARNLVIDEYRKKDSLSLDAMGEKGFDVRVDEHRTIEVDASSKEAVEAICKLDEIYREVALLRFVEGYPPKEIAHALGLSENVVSVRINRAIKKLRDTLNTGT